MVRFSRVWRAVLRMGHPQVRWSVSLMTQHEGMPAQLQGDGEGVEALPLNWVECGLACYLAVVCGVSLRHIALLFAALFLIPITKSSMKRWIDDIGSNLPPPDQMLQQLLALTPVTECHIDGYYPLGTDHCVMVVKDEHNRILMTHEAASENGDDARQFLQR